MNHRDVQYRWMMKNRSGVNEASVYTNAAIGGRELIAELWKPNEVGTPLRCKRTRNGFVLVE